MPSGLIWIRRREPLTYAAGEEGGWLLCGGQPRIPVSGPEEARAAMSAVWHTFERSFFKSAVTAGVGLGWVSALLLIAGLIVFVPRGRPAAAPSSAPAMAVLQPSQTGGGALDRLE